MSPLGRVGGGEGMFKVNSSPDASKSTTSMPSEQTAARRHSRRGLPRPRLFALGSGGIGYEGEKMSTGLFRLSVQDVPGSGMWNFGDAVRARLCDAIFEPLLEFGVLGIAASNSCACLS